MEVCPSNLVSRAERDNPGPWESPICPTYLMVMVVVVIMVVMVVMVMVRTGEDTTGQVWKCVRLIL